MNELLEIAKYAGGGGVGTGIVIGIFFTIKHLRNGRNPIKTPECPSKPYFEERKIEAMRQVEAFKAMIASWDRTAEALHEQARATRESGEKHADAIIKMAEMVTKRRD